MLQTEPYLLSYELRKEHSANLTRRRWILGLSLVGVAAGGIVALYQMGIVKKLPDYPVSIFNSTQVNASEYGYQRLQVPDSLLMIASYALTAVLVGAGGKSRAQDTPWIPLALFSKALVDLGTNLRLIQEEWRFNKALCSFCQTATLASFFTTILSFPEAREALTGMRDRAEAAGHFEDPIIQESDEWATNPIH